MVNTFIICRFLIMVILTILKWYLIVVLFAFSNVPIGHLYEITVLIFDQKVSFD